MSQLHERLEHLVNYSSQLIFVSSDSIADQQRTLSEFLSLQHESTEVSFFPADDEQSASDYRRIICRQLANHTVGSFVRPLKELLQDIDAQKGHYLVCISQADFLDAAFLNELWDWVTSCRQYNEELHINVILFAKEAWTEQAQTWLPSHHINKPVLLSSQSIDAVGFDVSALENLMAQKRAFFASDNAHSIIRKKWFILSVLSLFLVIFIALISLQYPQQIKHFMATGELPEAPSTSPTADYTQDSATNAEDDGLVDGADTSMTAKYEPQLEVIESSSIDSLFVSNWPTEEPTPVEPPSEPDTKAETKISETDQISDANEPSIGAPNEAAQETEQDFAVEDIVSVNQLDQQLQQTLNEDLDEPAAEANTSVIDEGERYAFDEQALLALPQNQIVLQLSGIQNRSVLQSYLEEYNLRDITWVYQTQRYGGDWFVVLYKQTFGSINEATEAANTLPPAIQQSSPFAKRVPQVQQEIRQR